MVYQQTLQAKLHSLGYPDPVNKEVKICETDEQKFKVNVLVRTKMEVKSWPGFGLRLVDARAAAANSSSLFPRLLPEKRDEARAVSRTIANSNTRT